MRLASVAAISVLTVAAAAAQSDAPSDPIRCWWKTSAGAVASGEPFDATLTCAVREEASTRTVPDESRLPAAVMQSSPFEVLGGSHPADLRSGAHRFFQYHYVVRIIDRDAIGRDVQFPDLRIPYRVDTLVNGVWNEGRERVYVVPGQQMRVLSLVPAGANDIRDAGDETFARVETLRFRSRALTIAAVALTAVGALVALPALAGFVRRRPERGERERRLTRRSVLAAAEAALAEVDPLGGSGWTPELAARALDALRIVAACAIGRPVAQHDVTDPATHDRRIAATRGWFRRMSVALSSAVTPRDLDAAIAALPLTTPVERRQALENLGAAMTAFTRAVYGERFPAGGPSLDEALRAGQTAARHFRARR